LGNKAGEFMLKIVPILLISLALISCGRRTVEGNNQPELNITSATFKTVGDSKVQVVKETLKGDGLVVATTPLKNGKDANYNYQLKFTLKENGSLKVLSHAQPPIQENGRYTALKGGIAIYFVRAGEQLRMNVSGKEIAPQKLKSIKASEVLNISLDVHNNEDHKGESHIALILSDGNTVEVHGTKGAGNYWGLELNQAEVLEASTSNAKIEG
jgi:hypothetical protein